MLGSAKLSGLAGHTAFCGDRFTEVSAARNFLPGPGEKGKSLYYPIEPPENDQYNPGRPLKIDLLNLPLRSQETYYETIEKLNDPSLSKTAKKNVTTQTGVGRLPLCAASKAFIHPTFFPLDPFHLFYENVMTFIWDIWSGVHAKDKADPVRLPDKKLKDIGDWIYKASATLPPSFCGPVRNPYEKRNSQYKIFEWMAVLHWYFIPMAIELGINHRVIQNFAMLVRIVEFAMTPIPRSETELAELEVLTKTFLEDFEEVYVQERPENISRMRLCIFQLIHVARHAKWIGSVRVGSQATAERIIGELARKILSQKSPYANLANLIHEFELIKILCLYIPELEPSTLATAKDLIKQARPYSQRHPITIKARQQPSSDIFVELELITRYIEETYNVMPDLHSKELDGIELARWGKSRLKSLDTLQSRASESKSRTLRQYRWFEAEDMTLALPEERAAPTARIYGEAHAFYTIRLNNLGQDKEIHVAIYTPLIQLQYSADCAVQGAWPEEPRIQVIECKHIRCVVGIWASPLSDRVYVLRKHPGLSMLTVGEKGNDTQEIH
ncbi:hypothetical protein BKA70DRAFT_1127754 [Coprinopsis sp. MPI-PUGE-AT-0042]|nr:hypothetical protein BKA70DRAFT_1127754 [Coprinopsis sp. MPI-PUGE-AT-0042]